MMYIFLNYTQRSNTYNVPTFISTCIPLLIMYIPNRYFSYDGKRVRSWSCYGLCAPHDG